MNNKILIGSIIAVTILIGVSFTSDVGYRSVPSDVKASPLFGIRSSRAIDEESEDLSCAYVGKGEEISLSIPRRDKKIELVHKVIDAIHKMDDKTYNRFIPLFITYIKQNKKFEEIDDITVVNALNRLRSKQEGDAPISLRNWAECTNDVPCTIGGWHFGCYIYWVTVLIFGIIGFLLRNLGVIVISVVLWFPLCMISLLFPNSLPCNE